MGFTPEEEELLNERNNDVADWIGRMPQDYWFKVAARERLRVKNLLEEVNRLRKVIDRMERGLFDHK